MLWDVLLRRDWQFLLRLGDDGYFPHFLLQLDRVLALRVDALRQRYHAKVFLDLLADRRPLLDWLD